MALFIIPAPRVVLSGALLLCLTAPLLAVEAPTDEATLKKAQLYAEVVLRLKDIDLNTDEKAKSRVEKALVANLGLPAYVDIVEAFALTAYDPQLIEMAVAHPDDAVGAKALRLVFAHNNISALETALASADGPALIRALGNANDQRAVALLLPIVLSKEQAANQRQDAVRALGKIEQGAQALLAAAADGQLGDLKGLAGQVLISAPWDAIRAAAAAQFPPPQSRDQKPLLSIAELASRSGERANGERVSGTICTICHVIGEKGINYGPALSEIGSKLGKDALYTAILYPDAGIEHNYATTVLTMRDGNTAIGIVVSDSEEDIAIKAIGGIVSVYKKTEVAKRSEQKTSSMPSGLQAAMTQQELIDLVEYLFSLKKP
jgi:putative heme-binding domain-containing protein